MLPASEEADAGLEEIHMGGAEGAKNTHVQ